MDEREKFERTMKLYETVVRHIGVRGILSGCLTFGYVWMLLRGFNVPNEFYTIYGMVLGYYFARVSENGLRLSNIKGDNDGKQ